MIAKEWRDARWKLLIALAAILVIVFVWPRSYEQIQADIRQEIEFMQADIESQDAMGLPPDMPAEARAQEIDSISIEYMRSPEYLAETTRWEIRNYSIGANVVLAPLAGLLGVTLISGEVGRGTIFLLLSRPVSRTRTLLTKYSICFAVLFAAALAGAIGSVVSVYAHGYPAGLLGPVEILASAGLFWLGTLFVLGVALLVSVLFGDVVKSMIAAVSALFVIFTAPDLVRALIEWLYWSDEVYRFGAPEGWYETFERFNPTNYWMAVNPYTGEFVYSQAAQNSLVCLAAAAVPLLLALWWFRRKAY